MSFNKILSALVRLQKHEDAFLIMFKDMNMRSLAISDYTLNIVINSLCLSGRIDYALAVFAKRGLSPDLVTFNTLLKGLLKEGRVEEAVAFFQSTQGFEAADIVSYGTLIDGLCKARKFEKAVSMFSKMKAADGVEPDADIYNILMRGASEGDSQSVKIAEGIRCDLAIFAMMLQRGIAPDAVTMNTMLSKLCCLYRWKEANELMFDMVGNGITPTVVTFNTLISGFFKDGMIKAAEKLLAMMKEQQVMPDSYTYSVTMDGYVKAGRIDEAANTFRSIPEPNLYCFAILMNAYFKDGRPHKALELIGEMESEGIEANVVVYNTLIRGLFDNERIREAIDAFRKMLKSNVTPNEVTHLALHQGLFKQRCFTNEEALLLFEKLMLEKEKSRKENSVAEIKVVVRKRPLNKKDISRKEVDIVTMYDDAYLMVHEPKLKVDLTAYVEKHEFCFDAVLDEHVTDDEVYRNTVEPIIRTIFQRTKATCFAYGQTGSGKTYTMQSLPLRAAEDLVRLLHLPVYRKQGFTLWLSHFEIYGGKIFDLLSDKKKLMMREDGGQEVCIVGLQEVEVLDVHIMKEYIERGNAARSAGSSGANEESSRSHAILQLVVKKHEEVKESNRNNSMNDVNESRAGKVVGKISFIDLAGSERGADTTDNDRQTRIEGAEINKSLLALKECIRALDDDQIHTPFSGSLTEVLRDSFVGNSRTVMISCISPNAGSCEHTLNTLRSADWVKSFSRNGSPRKDQPSSLPPSVKESSSLPTSFVTIEAEDVYEQSNFNLNGRDESAADAGGLERERLDV